MFDCVAELFAICVGEVKAFSLKLMVLFLGCVFVCWLIRVLSMCVVFVIQVCV